MQHVRRVMAAQMSAGGNKSEIELNQVAYVRRITNYVDVKIGQHSRMFAKMWKKKHERNVREMEKKWLISARLADEW